MVTTLEDIHNGLKNVLEQVEVTRPRNILTRIVHEYLYSGETGQYEWRIIIRDVTDYEPLPMGSDRKYEAECQCMLDKAGESPGERQKEANAIYDAAVDKLTDLDNITLGGIVNRVTIIPTTDFFGTVPNNGIDWFAVKVMMEIQLIQYRS